MIVVPPKRALVLKPEFPAQITQVLPRAIPVNYKGASLVVVPHKLEETRVLRNLGFDAPSPIRYYYQWAGGKTPFAHQRATSEFATLNPRAFILNDMGTGKTLSVLWAIDYLMQVGVVRKVLIAAPLSTLERVWSDELFFSFPHINHTVVYGDKAKRQKLLAQDADVYIMNHAGVEILQPELMLRDEIDLVVVDESAIYRNHKTNQWKALRRVLKGRKYIWFMTGSPTPNKPTDAWAQCALLCPENVPAYFTKFRDMTMRQLGHFRWVEREEALEIVRDAMRPAIRFKREDCLELPPITVSTRHVELSKEQQTAYKEMVTRLRTEYDNGLVTAVNEAVKAMKLVQIACGVAYAVDGSHVVIPSAPRIAVIKEIVAEAEGKVIVFVPLTGGLELIAEELRKDFSVEVVHGEVSKTKRDEIFGQFERCADPEVIVAHPKCMAHGLSLVAANVIVWYIPTWDNEIYEQACDRIPRPGQKRHMHIIHLEGTPVERKMYKRLYDKGEKQSNLLDMIQEDT